MPNDYLSGEHVLIATKFAVMGGIPGRRSSDPVAGRKIWYPLKGRVTTQKE